MIITSIRSVLARHPVARAKARTDRALSKAMGMS